MLGPLYTCRKLGPWSTHCSPSSQFCTCANSLRGGLIQRNVLQLTGRGRDCEQFAHMTPERTEQPCWIHNSCIYINSDTNKHAKPVITLSISSPFLSSFLSVYRGNVFEILPCFFYPKPLPFKSCNNWCVTHRHLFVSFQSSQIEFLT